MGNELNMINQRRDEYLKQRLGLVANAPELLAKIIYYNTNLAVTVFGGAGIALAFLHGDSLKPWMYVVMSIFVSLIGMLVASMIIISVENAKRSSIKTQIEINKILSMLNIVIPIGTIIVNTQEMVENEVEKESKEYKGLNESNIERQLKTADWLKVIVIIILSIMLLYLIYSLVALFLLINCPEAFKVIW